jgi:hypothetical protein
MGNFVKVEEESSKSSKSSSSKKKEEEKEDKEEEKEDEKDKKKRHNKKKEKASKGSVELQLEYWDQIQTKEKKKTHKSLNNQNVSNLNNLPLENQNMKQKSLKGYFTYLSVLNLPELCKSYSIDSLFPPHPGSLFSLVIQYTEKKRRHKFLLLTPKSNQLLCNTLSLPFSILVDDIQFDNVR